MCEWAGEEEGLAGYSSLQVHAGLHLFQACSSQLSAVGILQPHNRLLKTTEDRSVFYIRGWPLDCCYSCFLLGQRVVQGWLKPNPNVTAFSQNTFSSHRAGWVRDLVHWGVLLSDLLWGCPFVWFHIGKCWRGLGCYWAGFPARKGCQGAPCCWGAAWWGAKGGKKQQDMACVTPGLLLGLCAQCHIPFYVCKNASTGLHSVKCHGWSSCIGDCRVCVYIYI